MMGLSLYEKVKEMGIESDHHESDLYIPVTPETRELIRQYPFRTNVTTFISQIDKKLWYDIPFAYLPFWDKAARRK